jgi:precorrin-6A synthase
MVDRLYVIGIGAGDPAWLTLEAVSALGSLDVLFVLDKGDELTAARRALVARYAPQASEVAIADPPRGRGAEAVAAWRAERVRLISSALAGSVGVGGFLAWGDPSLYDGLIDVLGSIGAPFSVVPGISAASALAARHRVALNRVGGSVAITSGRRLAAEGMTADDVVVMLDSSLAFMDVDPSVEIYWGAYLGTPDELLVAGVLRDVRDEIVRVRSEARQRKGWMFDTYLLRRPRS